MAKSQILLCHLECFKLINLSYALINLTYLGQLCLYELFSQLMKQL